MNEAVVKYLDYVQVWITSIPPHSWYVAGTLLAAAGAVIGAVAIRKYRYFKKTGEKLASHFIMSNVIFWSTITTVLAFVITNGLALAPFFPFLTTHMPQIMAIATVVYTFSKSAKKWFEDREAGKPLIEAASITPVGEGVVESVDPLPGQPSSELLS